MGLFIEQQSNNRRTVNAIFACVVCCVTSCKYSLYVVEHLLLLLKPNSESPNSDWGLNISPLNWILCEPVSFSVLLESQEFGFLLLTSCCVRGSRFGHYWKSTLKVHSHSVHHKVGWPRSWGRNSRESWLTLIVLVPKGYCSDWPTWMVSLKLTIWLWSIYLKKTMTWKMTKHL